MNAPDKIYVNFPFGEEHPWHGDMDANIWYKQHVKYWRVGFKDGFKAGAEWMAGQGVRAHCVESANPISESPDARLHLITLLYEENEHTPYVRGGDNIDIIIRKK